MKIYNEFFDENYLSEKLNNGLRVYIFQRPEFESTTCAFGTPYGALNIHQLYDGKEYNFNPGIAHFLEHKLFEAKGDDMMAAFSALGASVNAFTSYHETVYYFSMSGEKIEEPLNLLLDFVQDLSITEESVEKEKGIIAQEVAMYNQMPNSRLLNELYASMYHNYPLKYDIGGNNESIFAISKDELESCYRINYHPCNMFLIIVTPLDPENIMKIVKDNQDLKTFSDSTLPITNNKFEPSSVKRKEFEFKMDLHKTKQVYGFKLEPNFKDIDDCVYKEWCFKIYLESLFSYLNPEYQKWLDEGFINDFFGYDVEFDLDSAHILFFIENDDENILKDLVDKTLGVDNLSGKLLEQIKRRYIGMCFESFNDIEGFTLEYIRDILEGVDLFRSIEILMNITIDDIKEVVHKMMNDNTCLVRVKPH